MLVATEEAIDRWHDPAPGSMLRIAVAPCSPFSVTRGAHDASRPPWRAATACACTPTWPRPSRRRPSAVERFGVRPVEYLDDLDWLGPDVWLAHCVHLSPRGGRPLRRHRHLGGPLPVVQRAARRRHRARRRPRRPRASPWGSASTAPPRKESGELAVEVREALLVARLRGGAAAMTARTALALGTIHGARCLGREDEIGSLEPGKLADIALWRIDGAGHAGHRRPRGGDGAWARRARPTALLVNGRAGGGGRATC